MPPSGDALGEDPAGGRPWTPGVGGEAFGASSQVSEQGDGEDADGEGEVDRTLPGGHREHLSGWAAPGSAVYANPICSQMDQLLLKCEDTEAVLALVVTHRGVFFVHNLVTAVQMLAVLSQEAGDLIATNALLRDSRYDMLIRDVLRFVPKFDFLAMTNIACSLWQLQHKHYLLMTRMLRPLLRQTVPDVATLLRCAQAYAWAGYRHEATFYERCAQELGAAASSMAPAQLVESCVVFGGVAQYHSSFFEQAESAVLERGLFQARRDQTPSLQCEDAGENAGFRPHEASLVAKAFAAHLRTAHDNVFDRLAAFVEMEAESMALPDIARCFTAFRRMALRYEGAMQAGLVACAAPLTRAWALRSRAEGVRTSDVAVLLECAAYFGVDHELTRVALEYLADHADEISEASAIQVVYALSATGKTGLLPGLLLLLFRKIGAGSAWETHRMRVFHLWISQLLQFPWLDARLPRRCLDAGLRAWCLHRRGYGCAFPLEARAMAAELEALGVRHRTFVAVPGTPYEVDIAFGDRKDALLVMSEVSRNTMEPVGGALLQIRHLQARGWKCVVVPRRAWKALQDSSAEARQGYLRSLMSAFDRPGTSALCATMATKLIGPATGR